MKQPNFARIITDLLEDRTQAELARQLGVTQSMVSRWKLMRHPDPSYTIGDKLIRLHEQQKESN